MTLVCSLFQEVHTSRPGYVLNDNNLSGSMSYYPPVDWTPFESSTDASNLSNMSAFSPPMIGDDSGDGLAQSHSPRLVIVEQPQEKFRFRYRSEMMGTHGCILGRRSDRLLKKYPEVKLVNFNGGPVIIRCSLVAYLSNRKEPVPHAHRLTVRVQDIDREEPQEIIVDEQAGYTAIFQGMGIVHTAKRYVVEELVKKKKRQMLDEIKGTRSNDTSLTVREEMQIKEESQSEAKMMNLNIVNLCFEALCKDSYGNLRPICDKVYSTPISNMKSAQTGELKICRIDKIDSSCLGGETIFILVEKVGKKNIMVRFFELDEEDNEIWEDFGKFTELDVHHQYAVVFKTPRYRDVNIEQPVDVFLQLFRPSDRDSSEPIRFTYKPRETVGRKRLRHQISYDTIPTAVVQGFSHQNETGLDTLLGLQSNNVPVNPTVVEKLQVSTTVASTFFSTVNSNGIVPNTPDELFGLRIEDLIAVQPENYSRELSLVSLDALDNNLAMDCVSLAPREGCSMHSDLVTDSVNIPPSKVIYDNYPDNLQMESNKTGKDTEETRKSKLRRTSRSHSFSEFIIKQMCDLGPNAETLKGFLERSTADGNMTLHLAVTYCKISLLKKLLSVIEKRKLITYVNKTNDNHQTALHLAVLIKDWEKVRLLLKSGAKPEMKDSHGNTVYHLAVCGKGQVTGDVKPSAQNPCLVELLERKNYQHSRFQISNLNLINKVGMTPLHLAVENGDEFAVEALVKAKCDINFFDVHGGCSALHMAIVAGNVRIVQILLSQPTVSVDYCNRRRMNALKLAHIIHGGDCELIKILREKMNIDEESARQLEEVESSDDDSDFQLELSSSPSHLEETSAQQVVDAGSSLMDGGCKDSDSSFVLEGETLDFISDTLDRSGKWKDLARFLEYDFLVLAIQDQSSPSRALLSYADIHGDVSVEKLKDILKKLGEDTAAKEIEKMMLRK